MSFSYESCVPRERSEGELSSKGNQALAQWKNGAKMLHTEMAPNTAAGATKKKSSKNSVERAISKRFAWLSPADMVTHLWTQQNEHGTLVFHDQQHAAVLAHLDMSSISSKLHKSFRQSAIDISGRSVQDLLAHATYFVQHPCIRSSGKATWSHRFATHPQTGQLKWVSICT